MFRWLGILGTVVMLGAISALIPARADACAEAECGKPRCWTSGINVRPTFTRRFSVYCERTVSARVVEAPPHSSISDVSVTYAALHFTVATDADAPQVETARFELTGTQTTIETDITLLAIPLSVNHAPICDGASATQRSDGTERVSVYLNPWCRDPDEDEFTMTGGGPGEHPWAPHVVPAGDSESNWSYVPSILTGTETTTLSATDQLGARSEPATLTVQIGPDVDRLPQCYPMPARWRPDGVYRVRRRAGAIRRFPIQCDDPDGDPYVATVTTLPTHGALAPVLANDPLWGEDWYDATYVPAEDAELDPFTVTATGVHGTGPATHMAMAIAPDDSNGGGGCGYGVSTTAPDVPGVVRVTCDDDDGDPIEATVTDAPAHGTMGPPVTTRGPHGQSDITIPYVPSSGYVGVDCVEVDVSDGHGMTMHLLLEIDVRVPPVVAPPDPELPEPPGLPELPEPPEVPVPTEAPVATVAPSAPVPTVSASAPVPALRPASLQDGGSSPVAAPAAVPSIPIADRVRAYVVGSLGTRSVRRTAMLPDVEVWTPRRLSRRVLRREGRAPGMLVLCAAGCEVRSSTGPQRRATRTTAVVAPSQPQLLWATATRRQLRAGRRLRMRVAISRTGAHRTLKRAFRLR